MAYRYRAWWRAGSLILILAADHVGRGLAAEVVVDPGGLTAAPATAFPGDTVTWTVVGPPGAMAAVVWSRAGCCTSFEGVPLAVGPDWQPLAVAPITSQGRMNFSLRVPDSVLPGRFFFQAATIEGSRVRLTNGAAITVQMRPGSRGGYY